MTPTIKIKDNSETVSVTVKADKYPQSIAGILWRYKPDFSADGKAGEFSSQISEIPLGLPGGLFEKFFLVEGGILNFQDNPPTPYQVVVTVRQGLETLLEVVPEHGGAGSIGKTDVPFYFDFQLKKS